MSARPDPLDVAALSAARLRVLETVADACVRAGRDQADVELVAVSKTVPAERLAAAVSAGLTVLGENRVQEAEGKAPLVPGATWHLVGPLQSNKARRALEVFSVIESVESVDLARRLDRLVGERAAMATGPGTRGTGAAAPGLFPVFLQVNVDRDQSKAGFLPESLPDALRELTALPHLALRGLMTVGRLVASREEARATFGRLRELSEELRATHPALGAGLSMGMSGDYAVAVEEGATLIRVGRAIFGERAR